MWLFDTDIHANAKGYEFLAMQMLRKTGGGVIWGTRYVATVRFHTEGVEAELYGRLMEGKKGRGFPFGLYQADFKRNILKTKDREDSRNKWLEQFGWEIARVVEQAVKNVLAEAM